MELLIVCVCSYEQVVIIYSQSNLMSEDKFKILFLKFDGGDGN